MMHSLNLLLSIATLCVGLMSLCPHMIHAIPFGQFYPFGVRAGDTVLPRTDDGTSAAISLGTSGFTYFGNSHSDIFVSSPPVC